MLVYGASKDLNRYYGCLSPASRRSVEIAPIYTSAKRNYKV